MNLDQHSYPAQIVDEATYQRMFTPIAWGWLDVVHGGQGGEEGIWFVSVTSHELETKRTFRGWNSRSIFVFQTARVSRLYTYRVET